MPTNKYTSAFDALPRRLLRQVQKHYTGLLWVPLYAQTHAERRQTIINLKNQGLKSSKIAQRVGLSRSRVNQILRAEAKAGQPEKS